MGSPIKHDPETVKSEVSPPLLTSSGGKFGLDVVLRVLLFAVTLTALILMVTAKQTEQVAVPGYPILVPVKAKFNYSPANIYFVAAMSLACLHSITSILGQLFTISKPAKAAKTLLYLAIWDVLVLGVVAAATGTSGGVAYVGLKGNKHAGWTKICSVYDTYCRHVGISIGLSLGASVILVMLVFLSVISLYRRIPRASY